ncbi:DUF5696 domain-containing protein [Cohnella thailandensis]|uniref:Uncharacterized protein n=1 Tax=Cohnella thailandensis TaxID=557557 RepID=A0A841T9C9_9BACL|nr:DUF5696 domain-containing protein [Cohnella thailandensis]MBB6637811.1 hypothetical protein [Cohnella thailandensis]MBP1974009.1 hypothetical protein [Cohnella thailandensis]
MKKIISIAVAIVLVFGSGLYLYSKYKPLPALSQSELPDLRDTPPKAAGNDSFSKPAVALEGMEGIVANGQLSLYYDPATMAIAVRDKEGRVWRSTPEKLGDDELANASVRDQMSSQLIISYSDNTGQEAFKTSNADSVMLGQAVAEPLENGLRVTYTLGKASSEIDSLPKKISAERYQALILDKVGDKYKRYLTPAYVNDNNKDVYERNDTKLTAIALKKVVESFQEAGYTAEDLAKDDEENGGSGSSEKQVFTIPVEYTLAGDQFIARIVSAGIQYPKSYPLTDIALLPYFGAAGLQDEGYLFVPDGSGSLIYLNNGKQRYEPFNQPVYGDDGGTWNGENDDDPTIEPIRMPVYGLAKKDSGFVAIIDQGAAVASVHAEVSRTRSSYNSVYPSFQLIGMEKINLSVTSQASETKTKEIRVFQQRPVYSDFSVRYAFLSGDKAGYTGMAEYYRDYLLSNGMLTKKADSQEEMPFYLELVGGIPKRKSILGVPYKAVVPLTTFDQAQTIIGSLKEQGISNQKVRLSGWFNGGYSHKVADKIKVDGSLGGSSGYKDLISYAEQEGIELFPDVSFTHLYTTSGEYTEAKAVSRYINRESAWVWERTDWARPLSPRLVPNVVDDFLSAYKKYGETGISVRNIGHQLDGDYRRNNVVDRVQSEEINKDQLEKIGARLPNIMTDGGNAYVLKYAKDIVEAPMSNNGYNITDEAVPFYQIVLHGYVDYAGAPANLSREADVRKYVLKSLEYGSNLYFKWIYAENSKVKNTAFLNLYSVHYQTWMDKAAASYKTVSEALNVVKDKAIVGHEKLAENVYRTTYEGGRTITVNYNDYEVDVDGSRIPAEDFLVGGDNR